MQTVYELDQGEVAEIIAATFAYNGLVAKDVAFDVSEGLKVMVTAESDPLRVRHAPDAYADSMTRQVLEGFRGRKTIDGT